MAVAQGPTACKRGAVSTSPPAPKKTKKRRVLPHNLVSKHPVPRGDGTTPEARTKPQPYLKPACEGSREDGGRGPPPDGGAAGSIGGRKKKGWGAKGGKRTPDKNRCAFAT